MFTWFKAAEPILIPAQLLTAMFGMGCTLALKDFLQIVRHPSGVALGMVAQWLVVPLLGQAFVWGFDLGPGWALGVLLITVTPGGAFSNLLTFVARGNTALSIAITLVSTLGCIVVAPLLLLLFAGGHLPAGFDFPTGRIIFEVLIYLVIPLGFGMAVRHSLEGHAERVSKVAIWTSMTLVVAIAVGALGSGKIQVGAYGWAPPAILVLFAFVIHYAALELFRGAGRTDAETVAIGMETSVRNGGVGLLLSRFFFPGQPEHYQMIYAILFYTGVQILVPLPTLLRHRWGRAPVLFRPPRPASPASEPTSGSVSEEG